MKRRLLELALTIITLVVQSTMRDDPPPAPIPPQQEQALRPMDLCNDLDLRLDTVDLSPQTVRLLRATLTNHSDREVVVSQTLASIMAANGLCVWPEDGQGSYRLVRVASDDSAPCVDPRIRHLGPGESIQLEWGGEGTTTDPWPQTDEFAFSTRLRAPVLQTERRPLPPGEYLVDCTMTLYVFGSGPTDPFTLVTVLCSSNKLRVNLPDRNVSSDHPAAPGR